VAHYGDTSRPQTQRRHRLHVGALPRRRKQSSVSFDVYDDAVWLCDLINRIGPAKALEIADRRDGAAPDAMAVAEWLKHHIDHLDRGD
jgi:hypothetical protein